MNYLALTGILNKFKRVAKANSPTPPSNILADFASGSLHLFNQLLQALYLKRDNTVIDCSLAHSTMYLSQLELLKEVTYTSLNRNKPKKGVAINAFTRPHEMVFKDKNGELFVLKPGTKIYEEIVLQHYNDEEAEEAKILSDIMQLTFNSMTIEEIEKEYCGEGGKVERVKKLAEAVQEEYKGTIPNVFDQGYQYHNASQISAEADGKKAL